MAGDVEGGAGADTGKATACDEVRMGVGSDGQRSEGVAAVFGTPGIPPVFVIAAAQDPRGRADTRQLPVPLLHHHVHRL